MKIAHGVIWDIATRGALAAALLAAPSWVEARGGHHGFGAGQHGHPINAWMGSHRPKLR